ncbi:unnamed protein product, partial [Allacma fusca]
MLSSEELRKECHTLMIIISYL